MGKVQQPSLIGHMAAGFIEAALSRDLRSDRHPASADKWADSKTLD